VTNGENSGISTQAPIEADIRKAPSQITTGKALGADNIHQVELKSDSETSVKFMHPLFADIWDKEEIQINGRKN